MDLLEATARLERIELLAKIAHTGGTSTKEKTIALAWIGEIAEEMREIVREETKKCQRQESYRSRCSFQ